MTFTEHAKKTRLGIEIQFFDGDFEELAKAKTTATTKSGIIKAIEKNKESGQSGCWIMTAGIMAEIDFTEPIESQFD